MFCSFLTLSSHLVVEKWPIIAICTLLFIRCRMMLLEKSYYMLFLARSPHRPPRLQGLSKPAEQPFEAALYTLSFNLLKKWCQFVVIPLRRTLLRDLRPSRFACPSPLQLFSGIMPPNMLEIIFCL